MISDEEAIKLGASLARAEGWPWIGVVQILRDGENIRVKSNAKAIGCNVLVVLDGTTGAVQKKSFMPR